MMLCNFKKNLKRHLYLSHYFSWAPNGEFEYEFSMIWRVFFEFEFQDRTGIDVHIFLCVK